MKYIAILAAGSSQLFDGVGDYANLLAGHLAAHVRTALVRDTRRGTAPRGVGQAAGSPAVPIFQVSSWRELWRTRHLAPWGEPDTWILQYVPQAFVARADVVWLLAWLVHLRVRRQARLVLTVHEYNVPWALSPRRIAARILLEGLFVGLSLFAAGLVVTHAHNARKLLRLLFWRRRTDVAVIPVGSNIPGCAPSMAARSGLQPRAPSLVYVIFGQPEAMSARLVSALGRWLSTRPEGVRLRWIGRSRDEILAFWTGRCGLRAELVEVLDGRSSDEVSRLLQSSDVCVAPLLDGVSTRRTTIIAALGHGLPIVGTDAKCTDPVFRQSHACLLSRPSDEAGFVRDVALALEDPELRSHMAGAARELFEDRFTWDRIARAYLAQLAPEAPTV